MFPRVMSVNAQKSENLGRLRTFIEWFQPDVICLQELAYEDRHFFMSLLGTPNAYGESYVTNGTEPKGTSRVPFGLGIFVRKGLRLTEVRSVTLTGRKAPISWPKPGAVRETLLFATVTDTEGQTYRIATTHLRVTEQGEVTPTQLASIEKMLKICDTEVKRHGGLLLTGDFNAPRGREAFTRIAHRFTDGVPPHYATSIDGNLHRAGQLMLMVDGLFHTPNYGLEYAALHPGVSDHCALTATLSKHD